MNIENALRLNDWVVGHADHLGSAARGTISSDACAATDDLKCKVTSGNLSAVLRKHGIETKRLSDKERQRVILYDENERLRAENMLLRRIIAKVESSKYLPDDLKEYILSSLPQEIREALAAGR